MKKFTLILIVALLVACTACSPKPAPKPVENAYDLYTAMNTAMKNVTSMQAKADVKMNMQSEGENADMNMFMDIKQILRSETDLEMALLMSIDMGELGGLMDAKIYYKDGYLYQEIMGMKVKMRMALEEAMAAVNMDAISSLNFEKDAISQSEVKNVDGGKELSFTLKGDALNDTLTEMVNAMIGSLDSDVDMKLTFGDVSYTLLLGSDNFPKKQHIVYSMDMEVDGEKTSISYDMYMTDLSYNTIKAIEYPADLDDYMEIAL